MNVGETKFFYENPSISPIPGIPFIILEKTLDGAIVGKYTAYFNPRTLTYRLIPFFTKYAWYNDRLHKQTISVDLVRRYK